MSDAPYSEEVFNLIRDPWLPVRRRSGIKERIPPSQINDGIEEDPIVGFDWPRPDFNGAAHEFLIGLLSTAIDLSNDQKWSDWWSEPPKQKILDDHFAKLQSAFNLDGSGPRFLQDYDSLERAQEKKIETLLIDAPGEQTLKNNADLFVKRGNTPVLCRAAAAMALYTLNAYAPTGGSGHRTSLRGGGPITTLVVADHKKFGSTLWGRLWPNVETRKHDDVHYEGIDSNDFGTIFPWLTETRTSDSGKGSTTTPLDIHPMQVYWGMPRRIRLSFAQADGRRCSLTDLQEPIIAENYYTQNYGINYSEGFVHPLTPYYQEAGAAKLPFHTKSGSISYRLWPGLVVPTSANNISHEPAKVIMQWPERKHNVIGNICNNRFVAFGYDMNQMKARAWIEGEMPLWQFGDQEKNRMLVDFINQAAAGASKVANLLTDAIKSALRVIGDYGVVERFYRETEAKFYATLQSAQKSIKDNHSDDPTLHARKDWLDAMAKAAMQLFDQFAPADRLEDRNMYRYVKAQSNLERALKGCSSRGKSLFNTLGIRLPELVPSRKKKESA